jgi:hypothetical protein
MFTFNDDIKLKVKPDPLPEINKISINEVLPPKPGKHIRNRNDMVMS